MLSKNEELTTTADLSGVKKSTDYNCPTCGQRSNDNEYTNNNEAYPKIIDKQKSSTEGNYVDWKEVHSCEKCRTKFWFVNGI